MSKDQVNFQEFSIQWMKALEPMEGEEEIEFPTARIFAAHCPKWPGASSAARNIPIGPLESMYAMYHWYLFFGRHLLRQEMLQLANYVFPGMGIKFEPFFDNLEKPKDECKAVLESLDDKNRDRLKRRCHRWFKEYLRTTPQAKVIAKHLLGL